MKRRTLTLDEMTPDQVACFGVLVEVFCGAHHVPPVAAHGDGIRVSTFQDLSTFDFDRLTRLVFAAHDHCVRVSVLPSSPKHVGIALWKRKNRDGFFYDRHPSLETAVAKWRSQHKDRAWVDTPSIVDELNDLVAARAAGEVQS